MICHNGEVNTLQIATPDFEHMYNGKQFLLSHGQLCFAGFMLQDSKATGLPF